MRSRPHGTHESGQGVLDLVIAADVIFLLGISVFYALTPRLERRPAPFTLTRNQQELGTPQEGVRMSDDYEFSPDETETAFDRTGGYCECCGKKLSWGNSRANPGKGQWEAHHGSRSTPVILCTGEPENCHLNCGHDGNFKNPGITPRVHKGG